MRCYWNQMSKSLCHHFCTVGNRENLGEGSDFEDNSQIGRPDTGHQLVHWLQAGTRGCIRFWHYKCQLSIKEIPGLKIFWCQRVNLQCFHSCQLQIFPQVLYFTQVFFSQVFDIVLDFFFGGYVIRAGRQNCFDSLQRNILLKLAMNKYFIKVFGLALYAHSDCMNII